MKIIHKIKDSARLLKLAEVTKGQMPQVVSKENQQYRLCLQYEYIGSSNQGGFASFILLCGITVNASIYIMNEYNSIRRQSPLLAPLRAYTKAWNRKVIPIFLTVMSTVLGFIPFMVGTEKEGFWFPLAAGTIGGLMMSVVGIFLFLPMMTIKLKKRGLYS